MNTVVRPSSFAARVANFDASREPRILLLTEFFPFDLDREAFGGFQRLRHHLDALAPLGRVDVVFLVHQEDCPAAAASLAAVHKRWRISGSVRLVATGARRRSLRRWVSDGFWAARGAVGFLQTKASMATSGQSQAAQLRRLLDELQPDFIFAHRLGAAAPLLRTKRRLPKVVVDVDDIEHVRLERLTATLTRPVAKLRPRADALLARHAVRQIGKMATLLLVTSNLDRRKLGAVCPGARIATVPNSAVPAVPAPMPAAPTALFVGTATYAPNAEALVWLAREVWPRVRKTVPRAKLIVVGEGGDRLGLASEEHNVECTGFATDLRPLYGAARLALCPVQRGGGTRIKILEAAANGRPVVSTTIGAEGLAFKPDTEILIADTPAAFAAACVRLLRETHLPKSIGAAAQRRAASLYSSAHIVERLRGLCAEAIEASQSSGDEPLPLSFATGQKEIGTAGG